MKKNNSKFIIISLYQSFPSYHGASDISFNLFRVWPNRNISLIQTSIKKNKTYKKIISVKKRNGFWGFIINIFQTVLISKKLFLNFQKKIIIIEGAIWAGYSLILLVIAKLFINNVEIIYHGHNLEYEVRKKKNSFYISFLTFYFEKLLYKFSYGSTVSLRDHYFVKKYYKEKSRIFNNGVLKEKSIKPKNLNIKKKKFIFYCGSYTYWPNKIAIDRIVQNKDMIFKILKNYKIIFTGEQLPKFKDKNLINLGVVKKENLAWLYKNCFFFYAPLPFAPGTKIKIIEALTYNAKLICTRHAMVGINKIFNKNLVHLITKNNLVSLIKKIKNDNLNKKNLKFENYYNFRKITKKFYDEFKKNN